ncbi:unannotated protein [freshwater metagenome]|uniref:Unannotated protein n=1 Tax=freshwater metagenome TaxID=449393 RepID=A0A6J7CTC1_9ZZZZ
MTSRVGTDPHPRTGHLAGSSATSLLEDLAAGRTTATALTEAVLERIGAIDAPGTDVSLRSVIATSPDALAEARARDADRAAGAPGGPLQGLPTLIKDNIEAIGLPATAGSLALQGRAVASDSPVVVRLRAAGAIIAGSTNLSEWANFRSPNSTSGWSAVGGITGNPWALDRSAGGSSAGSGAAVAAGLVPFAVGTETNGSITCPASLNGVVGLKPTVGSVPATGIVPIAGSQDVPGPLARCVLDAALLFEVMSATSGAIEACTAGSARSVRVGVAHAWLTGHAATDALFEAALAVLGPNVAGVNDVRVPALTFDVRQDQTDVLVGQMSDDLGAYLAARPGLGVRSLHDLVQFNVDHAATELAFFGQEYLEQSAASEGRASASYQAARDRNVRWARDLCFAPALELGIDVIVAPAYAPSWKSDLVHGDFITGGGDICTPAAILGWPILTVPMGLADGLPVGLALTGPANSEARLLAVGRAIEVALDLRSRGLDQPTWNPAARG